MKKRLMAVILATAMALSLMTACQKAPEKTKVYVYNWGEYISNAEETYSFFGEDYDITDVVADFERDFPQYDVEMRYFDDNEKMYAVLDKQSYDVIIPSDYMITRLMRENKLQKLDPAKLPNVAKYMDPKLKDITYSEDPAVDSTIFDYAAPYFYCTVGLMYNQDELDKIEDNDPKEVWSVLFDADLKNQIGMYNSMRESIGMALNYLGYSMNTLDEKQLGEAMDLLIQQRTDVQPIVGIDELKDKFVNGELLAGVAWSGDHVVCQQRLEEGEEDPEMLQYVLPKGSNISVDMMAIPTNAKNVEGAHAFINYMYDPAAALSNAVYVGYSSPHTEVLAKLPEQVTQNRHYYPDAETIKTLELYYSNEEIDTLYDRLWTEYLAN